MMLVLLIFKCLNANDVTILQIMLQRKSWFLFHNSSFRVEITFFIKLFVNKPVTCLKPLAGMVVNFGFNDASSVAVSGARIFPFCKFS